MGKPITGKSFGGCVRYVVNRKEATILDAVGVRTRQTDQIIEDLNIQRKLRPELGKAVGHTVLSWSAMDKAKLDDARMVEVAKAYMEKMGIKDTQYLIVKHTDKAHPHLHIIFNRVNDHGKTITDKNDYRRNVKVCRALTEAYGFHLGKGKEQVNRQALKGKEQIRYAIYDQVKTALKTAEDWEELRSKLQEDGVELMFKYKGKTDEIQGISFQKNGIKFKGSSIDRSMSYAKINTVLNRNKVQLSTANHPTKSYGNNMKKDEKHSQMPAESIKNELIKGAEKLLDIVTDPTPVGYEYDPVEQEYKRKKKKRKRKGIRR